MKSCKTFAQMPHFRVATASFAMCVNDKLDVVFAAVVVSLTTGAAWCDSSVFPAEILASACLLKCKIVPLRNCTAPLCCQHAAHFFGHIHMIFRWTCFCFCQHILRTKLVAASSGNLAWVFSRNLILPSFKLLNEFAWLRADSRTANSCV